MKRYLAFLCLFALPLAAADFDIRDYGAVGDDATDNTTAIQAAIDECANAGGGRVVVPAGVFLSGPLFLRSHIEFHLTSGAVLAGTGDISAYPPIEGRWEGVERTVYASLLTALDAEQVAITGRGTLDGRGTPWWKAHEETQQQRREAGISGRESDNPPEASLRWPRPRVINLYRCTDVLISGVTIINSPSWTVHPVYCDNVLIDGITIKNPYDSPNTDGIDPDSCTSVRIVNCYISCGDDCIAIKSGYNADGRRVGRPSENIIIANCTFAQGRGGVTIGSETSGDVRNVSIANCVFDGTLRAIRIKSGRGRGGIVENITASNLVARNIPGTAISITARYGTQLTELIPEPNETTPNLRSIRIDNVLIDGAQQVAQIVGLPEAPLKDVSLTGVTARNVVHGLFAEHVEGLILRDVILNPLKGDAFRLQEVARPEIDRPGGSAASSSDTFLKLKNVTDAWIHTLAPPSSGKVMRIEGGASDRIYFRPSHPEIDPGDVEFGTDTDPDALTFLPVL